MGYYYLVGFIILILTCIAIIQYEKCPPFCMIVVYNRIGTYHSIVKIKEGKGVFVIPFIQGCLVLPVDSISKSLTIHNARTKDNKFITISIIYTFLFSKEKEIFQNAVDKLQGYSMDRISGRIEFLVQKEIMNKIATLNFADVFSEKTFFRASKNSIEYELNDIGIELKDLIVENMTEGTRKK